MELPYYNSTSYPISVKEQILKNVDSIETNMHFHQLVTHTFFTRNEKQRGLLVAYSMGLGKTKLAVEIAEYFINNEPSRNINIILPKSLEGNMRNTIKKYREDIDAHYNFISMNASNMFKQVASMGVDAEYEEYLNKLSKKSTLEHTLLIMDEAHNFFNSITNGSKNAVGLYDMIMKTKDIKIIFLTGTPMINDPFELVPCFNMLRGTINTATGGSASQNGVQHSDKYSTAATATSSVADLNDFNSTREKRPNQKKIYNTLFTEDVTEFEDYFIDRTKKRVKNKEKFVNRIYGLTSYYGDIYFNPIPSFKDPFHPDPPAVTKPKFPKELPTIVERVPMSEEQYVRYLDARILEMAESKFASRQSNARFSAGKSASSTYRVKTRQISNYCIPEYALGPQVGKKSREKFIERITVEDLKNVQTWSPKFAKILDNIRKHIGAGLVYSQFVSGEGLGIFAKVLESYGYINVSDNTDMSMSTSANIKEYVDIPIDDYELDSSFTGSKIVGGNIGVDTRALGSVKSYAILSGDVPPEMRTRIIKIFNSKENINGSLISLLLISGALSEGTNLLRIRHIHIMEPFWNYARIQQVKTRGIRYESHIDLPESAQNVQVYIYLSDYPKENTKFKEFTTDIDLYLNSITNMRIINSFMLAVAESSIDCSVHWDNLPEKIKSHIHCKLCAPTNAQMFHPSLKVDMQLESNCKPFSETKVKAKAVEYLGKTYYYKKNEQSKLPTIYYFNNKLNNYTTMTRDNIEYADVLKKVIELENLA